MENLLIDTSKYDIALLLHDLIEEIRNEERTYPNALPAEQCVHLVSSLFPSIDWSGVELGNPLPASLRAELEAQGGDVMVSVPPNEAAVLRKYRKW